MSREEFLEQWKGYALTVLPPTSPKEMQSTTNQECPLSCTKATQDLGDFLSPLVQEIVAKFMVKNISSVPVEVGRLIPSCGCTKTSISKTKLMPNDEAEIVCHVSESGVSGPQRYKVAVPVIGSKAKPLQLEFRVNLVPLISVQPLRLYFGRFLKSKLPVTVKVQILKAAGNVEPEIKHHIVSAPWISAKVKGREVEVSILPQAPLGELKENLQIHTNVGAINVPITGECVGGFRCVPNPLVSYKPDQESLKFKIVKTEGSTCNFDELEFKLYDKDKFVIVPQETKGYDTEREYILCFLKDQKGIGSYHVDICDPRNEEVQTLNIVYLAR